MSDKAPVKANNVGFGSSGIVEVEETIHFVIIIVFSVVSIVRLQYEGMGVLIG